MLVLATIVGLCAAAPAGLLGASGGPAGGAAPTSVAKGSWPGLGTVCEKGPGGGATARGVGPHTIDIATFADPGNAAEPGLNKEFFELAGAFATWCNAAGGIDGRTLVVHDRDAALFNAAQVTDEACQQDFMAVGGGLVFDDSAAPVRVGCGLGSIPAYVVSNQADTATLQVNPQDIRVDEIEAGWYAALGRRYPQAVRHFGIGAANEPSILDPTRKWEQAAEQLGWKVVDWQEPPFTVTDWAPYVADAQTKGVQALETPTGTNVATYFEAMQIADYDPTLIFLGIGIPEQLGKQTTPVPVSGPLPPIYFATQTWPFALASQSPGLEQLIALMRTEAPHDPIDTNDEYAVDDLVALRQVGFGLRGRPHRVVRAGPGGGAEQLDRRWCLRPHRAPGPLRRRPDAERLLRLMEVKGSEFAYDRADTRAQRPDLALRPQEPGAGHGLGLRTTGGATGGARRTLSAVGEPDLREVQRTLAGAERIFWMLLVACIATVCLFVFAIVDGASALTVAICAALVRRPARRLEPAGFCHRGLERDVRRFDPKE